MTMRDAATVMCGESRNERFAVNYALNQYGAMMAKRITALIMDGREVSTAQVGDGFFVDGQFRSCRDILGRDWWR